MNRRLAVLLAATGVAAADQVLKAALRHPQPTPTTAGATVGGLLVLMLLGCATYFLGWRRNKTPTLLASSLLCAGSASNGLDRILRGGVVVYVPWGDGRAINLADVVIVVGTTMAAVLLVARLIGWMKAQPSRSTTP
jgi:lipoprotein signal peptidase